MPIIGVKDELQQSSFIIIFLTFKSLSDYPLVLKNGAKLSIVEISHFKVYRKLMIQKILQDYNNNPNHIHKCFLKNESKCG